MHNIYMHSVALWWENELEKWVLSISIFYLYATVGSTQFSLIHLQSTWCMSMEEALI